MASQDPFGAAKMVETALGRLRVYDLNVLAESGVGHVDRLPYSIKVLLEAVLRNLDGFAITEEHVEALANYNAKDVGEQEVPLSQVGSSCKTLPVSPPWSIWPRFEVRCNAWAVMSKRSTRSSHVTLSSITRFWLISLAVIMRSTSTQRLSLKEIESATSS